MSKPGRPVCSSKHLSTFLSLYLVAVISLVLCPTLGNYLIIGTPFYPSISVFRLPSSFVVEGCRPFFRAARRWSFAPLTLDGYPLCFVGVPCLGTLSSVRPSLRHALVSPLRLRFG